MSISFILSIKWSLNLDGMSSKLGMCRPCRLLYLNGICCSCPFLSWKWGKAIWSFSEKLCTSSHGIPDRGFDNLLYTQKKIKKKKIGWLKLRGELCFLCYCLDFVHMNSQPIQRGISCPSEDPNSTKTVESIDAWNDLEAVAYTLMDLPLRAPTVSAFCH